MICNYAGLFHEPIRLCLRLLPLIVLPFPLAIFIFGFYLPCHIT